MNAIMLERTDFEVYKQWLLLRKLSEVGYSEAHAGIMLEAEVASRLARQTPWPRLVFPCLFEERAGLMLARFEERHARYWGQVQRA